MEDIILQCLKKVYEPTTHYLQCRSGSNFFRFGGIVVMRHLTVASGEPTSNPVSLVNIDNTAIKQKCQMIRVNFKSATMSYLNQRIFGDSVGIFQFQMFFLFICSCRQVHSPSNFL